MLAARRLRLGAVALLLLGACSVKTEGAACLSSDNCPSGQACGYDQKCSAAAAACAGTICRAHECSADGATLRRCEPDAAGICAALQDIACADHRTCQTTGGVGACACAPNRCKDSLGASLCEGTRLVTCQQDASSLCWFESPSTPCADPGQSCSAGACTCTGTAGPALGQLCATGGATACNAGQILRCDPVAGSAACRTWVLVESCAAAQLACNAAATACVCPPAGTTLFADATATPIGGVSPTGAELPAACRHASLGAALAAAASGYTVKATGFSAAPVVFSEGPLTVPAGVTLTTTDAPLTTTHYVIEPAATVGSSAFVTLAPGATLSGFEIRNAAATGDALQTACPAPTDTAPVAVSTVRVTGLGAGATPPRFLGGLRHAGHCPTTLAASTIDGCVTNLHAVGAAGVAVSLTASGCTFTGATDSGVYVQALGSGASSLLTLTDNTITGNDATTPFNLADGPHRGGGVLFTAPFPSSVSFTGNRVSGNKWNQILVAASSGAIDLRGGTACGAQSNTIACYDGSNVGLYSNGATVQADWNHWVNQPAQAPPDLGGTGISASTVTSACSLVSTCP